MRLFHTSPAIALIRRFVVFLTLASGCVLAGGTSLQTEVDAAWRSMQLGRWVDAGENITALKLATDDADLLCQAHLAEGNLWQFRRPGADMARAVASYEWVLKNHPDNRHASWALLALARLPDLDVLSPKPDESIPLYRRVAAEYPDSDAAQEAMLHLALALWKAGGVDGAREGVAELERWRAAHPNPDYALHAALVLGKLYRYPLGECGRAVTHLRAALDTQKGSSFAQRAQTCWTIASLAEHDLKDRAIAIEYYTRFIREFPNHRTTFMVKQGLARLGAPVPVTNDGGLLNTTIDAQPPASGRTAGGVPENSTP